MLGECFHITFDRTHHRSPDARMPTLPILREVEHLVGFSFAVADEYDARRIGDGLADRLEIGDIVRIGVAIVKMLSLAFVNVVRFLAERAYHSRSAVRIRPRRPHERSLAREFDHHESFGRITHLPLPPSLVHLGLVSRISIP